MSFEQRKLIISAFVTSQFSYCPLVCMFHSRTLNNRINRIHERALRIIYQDYQLPFEELLSKDKSVTIHQRNLRILVTELYKAKMGFGPEIMSEVFNFIDSPYNLRNEKLASRNIHTVKYGSETLSYVGAKVWGSLPNEYKNTNSIGEFKSKIRSWIPTDYPCRICKTYIQNLGFL